MTVNLSTESSAIDQPTLGGKETMRLRLVFLVPLAVAITVIVTTLILVLYQREQGAIQDDVIKIRASAQEFYEDSIRYDARALRTVMDSLQHDHELYTALKRGDRQELFRHTASLFDDIKRDFSITHLYFTGVDRVNLLRVHAPQRFGDTINRITMLDAEKSGTTAYGVELGPLGTFTLRLVTPWYDPETRELIGYVELGMEIDQVLQKLRDFFDVEVYVLIHKEFLQREKWEAGMRALNRTPDWEHLPSVIVAGQSPQVLPAMITEQLTQGSMTASNTIFESKRGGYSFRVAFLPLIDAGNRNIAHMVLLTNISDDLDTALHTVYVGSVTAIAAGILLLLFFNWQVGRIGRHIESNELELEKLASHDGLTGLYNHRSFYTQLNEEISRARRYDRPLAVLMLDIDHFKNVNDSYGHPAGDSILRGLSDRLVAHVRNIDRVCRYGGEEIAIILPETGVDMLMLAERLRVAIERLPFDIGQEQKITITVSIGAACFPADADSAETLVAAADTALYMAKQSGRNIVCNYSNTVSSSEN